MRKRLTAAGAVLCAFLTLLPARARTVSGQADREIWLTEAPWYGLQLNGEDRKAWNDDVESILAYPARKTAERSESRRTALTQVIRAENPRLFWVDWIDSYGRLCFYTDKSAVKGNWFAPVWPRGETLDTLKKKFLRAIEEDVTAIRAALPPEPSRYDILKEIVDWICDHNLYNSDQTGNSRSHSDPVEFGWLAAHSAYSAIVPGDSWEPVCEGYALAFRLLCEEFGIPCVCVMGSTVFAESHMWNCVQMEDETWRLVDVAGVDREDGIPYTYSYFLIGRDQALLQGYTPDSSFGSSASNGTRFSFPELAEGWRYVPEPELSFVDTWGGGCVHMEGRNSAINSGHLYLLYTMDGREPDLSSPSSYRYCEDVYEGTITKNIWISDETVFKAVLQVGSNGSSSNGYRPWEFRSFSAPVSLTVELARTEEPGIARGGGRVTLTPPASASEAVRLYYTTDGSDPVYRLLSNGSVETNPAQFLYEGSFPAVADQVIRAIAVDVGCQASDVRSEAPETGTPTPSQITGTAVQFSGRGDTPVPLPSETGS